MAFFGRDPWWSGPGDPPGPIPQSEEVNEQEDRDITAEIAADEDK